MQIRLDSRLDLQIVPFRHCSGKVIICNPTVDEKMLLFCRLFHSDIVVNPTGKKSFTSDKLLCLLIYVSITG